MSTFCAEEKKRASVVPSYNTSEKHDHLDKLADGLDRLDRSAMRDDQRFTVSSAKVDDMQLLSFRAKVQRSLGHRLLDQDAEPRIAA